MTLTPWLGKGSYLLEITDIVSHQDPIFMEVVTFQVIESDGTEGANAIASTASHIFCDDSPAAQASLGALLAACFGMSFEEAVEAERAGLLPTDCIGRRVRAQVTEGGLTMSTTAHFGPDHTCDCDGIDNCADGGPGTVACDLCREGDGPHCRAGDWQPSERDLRQLQRGAEAAGDQAQVELCAIARASGVDSATWLAANAKCREVILYAAARVAEEV